MLNRKKKHFVFLTGIALLAVALFPIMAVEGAAVEPTVMAVKFHADW
jgi:hypothetical protein